MFAVPIVQKTRVLLSKSVRCTVFSSPTWFSDLASMKPKVYVTKGSVAPIGIQLLEESCDVSVWKEKQPVPRDELLRNVVGKDAIYCTLTEKIDRELLDAAGPALKVVATISVGYDHIDLNECKKRGIRVGYTPWVLTDATAELTIGLLLATSRRLIEANRAVYTGDWKAWEPSWMCGPGLKDSVVGIIGFGKIGEAVARRAHAFSPSRIIFYNRSKKVDSFADINASQVSLDELYSLSDFVIVTIALAPETRHLINAEALAKMKTNAILVNTSRGDVVDQTALADALRSQRIRAAGLDVTSPEPLPLDSPLLTLPNCVVLPHIGSAEINTRMEMSRMSACNILAALNGEKMMAEL